MTSQKGKNPHNRCESILVSMIEGGCRFLCSLPLVHASLESYVSWVKPEQIFHTCDHCAGPGYTGSRPVSLLALPACLAVCPSRPLPLSPWLGELCDFSHGLGQFRQDTWIRQHGHARHRTTALVGLKKLVEGGTHLEIIMSVSNPHHDLRTEEPMSCVERGQSIALDQDGIAHGREARLGSWRGTGCASARTSGRGRRETRALLTMARGRHGRGRGKEIKGHGRAIISALVDPPGGLLRGGIPDLARGGFPQMQMAWAKSVSFRAWTTCHRKETGCNRDNRGLRWGRRDHICSLTVAFRSKRDQNCGSKGDSAAG